MGELNSLILAQGIQSTASAGNAYAQTNAMRGAQQYATSQTNTNNQWAELKKQDVRRQGDIAASRIHAQGEQNADTLRVKQSAGGVDVNSGSAAQVQNDQRLFAEVSKLDAQNAAYMRAIGISSEQSSMKSRDRLSRLATSGNIRNTLLQTGMQAGSDLLRTKYMADRYGGLGGGMTKEQQAESDRIGNARWEY